MSNFDSQEIVALLVSLVTGKGVAYADQVLDQLKAKWPDAAALLDNLRAFAHALAELPDLAAKFPAALTEIVATIRAASGPVDTAGGMTL